MTKPTLEEAIAALRPFARVPSDKMMGPDDLDIASEDVDRARDVVARYDGSTADKRG